MIAALQSKRLEMGRSCFKLFVSWLGCQKRQPNLRGYITISRSVAQIPA